MSLHGSDSMMHSHSSDFDQDTTVFLASVLDHLDSSIELAIADANVPRGAVRSTGSCQIYVLMNSTDIYIVGKSTHLVSSTRFTTITEGRHTANEIHSFAIMDMGLNDPFVIQIGRSRVESEPLRLKPNLDLTELAAEFVRAEASYRSRLRSKEHIASTPNAEAFQVQEDRCFVMMPFGGEFDGIYRHYITKVVESKGFECKRADDYFGPRVIKSDIGKLIRGSKLLIADLSHSKANVYYELGIAHTVGKSPILIQQVGTKREFDVQHLRILEYENNADGLAKLEDVLARAIDESLNPPDF